MTWNGRVTVHDDLSRLHASSRAGDTSREIGYSSVTEGEGSLDLLTESGDVRASLGDQPDGRFGVSIWHRGSLRFIPDLIQDLQDEDDSLSGRITTAQDTATNARGRADAAYTRGDDAWDRAGRALADAATAQATGTNARGRADAAYTRADDAWDRAGRALADAATAQSRADSAHNRIDGLDYATPGELSALRDRVASVESQIDVIDSWLRQHTGYPSGGLNPNS
ncbi:hypothetical protein [Brachybacterium massiliense]|uniref:hypothetical protein n=1 Tax=Brachybacterium massiliense TaxID=1755098 RepID=UPI000B3BAD65|nr:hypothetical protein [Brachybacterium massiliense]